MNILDPKRSRTFHTSVYPSVIRTGVIADGSCFYHALCHSLFQEYRDLSDMEKRQFAQKIRLQLIEELTIDQVKELSQGESYRMQFILNLRFVLQKTPAALKKYSFEFWDNQVLSKISTDWKDTSFESLIRILTPLIPEYVERILPVFELSEKIMFRHFKKHIQNEWVDELGMELISNYFQCNFYFFHSNTRLPYHTYIVKSTHRRNLVFLWVGESHYESLGELYQKTKVKRVFTNRDRFILAIRKHLKLD